MSQRGVNAGTERTALLHFTLSGDYMGDRQDRPKFVQQLQYCTHPHSITTSRKLSKMRLLSGSGRSRGPTCCMSLLSRPQTQQVYHTETLHQPEHGTTAALYTDIPYLRYYRIHLIALRKDVHASFSAATPCAENRSISSRTRHRNANLCTLPISLLSVLTVANEQVRIVGNVLHSVC